MDEVEILDWLNDSRSADRAREQQRNGDRIERDGHAFRIIEVVELEKPLGAPKGARIWMVKGQRT